MTCLAVLQSDFQSHLLGQPSDVARQIVVRGISVEQRLHIYCNAYQVRLLENLKDAFEKTWAYLGDAEFEAAASAFINEHPPLQRNLRWYGEDFPEWLASRHVSESEIAELALIDWQLRHAFDGPDASPLAVEDIACLMPEDWERVGFGFVPTLAMSSLRTNSIVIWRAIDEEKTPPASVQLPESQWLITWRKGWQPHFRTIHPIERFAMSLLIQGDSFAAVCQVLEARWPERGAAKLAAQYLAAWLSDGLLSDLTFQS